MFLIIYLYYEKCGCFRLNIIYHTDLGELGIPFPQVFLVSSFERSLYDFPFLREMFKRDLHAHKRDALLFALSDINQKIINEKKETFQSKIKYYSTLSGAVAGVPLPGLSAAVDIGLIIKVVKEYVAGFGLDKPSLEKLASSSGVPYTDLFAVIKSPLAKGEINKELILKILTQLACTAALLAAEEGFRWIPVIGILASIGLSFTFTNKALNHFLDTLAEDAETVFKRALNLD